MPRPLIRCHCSANQRQKREERSADTSTTCELLPIFRAELADIDRSSDRIVAEHRARCRELFLLGSVHSCRQDRDRERKREREKGSQICEDGSPLQERALFQTSKVTRLIKSLFEFLFTPQSKFLPNTLGVVESETQEQSTRTKMSQQPRNVRANKITDQQEDGNRLLQSIALRDVCACALICLSFF